MVRFVLSALDPVVDLLRDLLERLLHVIPAPRRRLHEMDPQRVRVREPLLHRNLALGLKVRLARHDQERRSERLDQVLRFRDPRGHALERLTVGYVVRHDRTHGIPVVRLADRSGDTGSLFITYLLLLYFITSVSVYLNLS